MAVLIASETDRAVFIAGLSWATLAGRKNKRNAEVRQLAKEADASSVLVVSNGSNAAAGMFSEEELDSGADDILLDPEEAEKQRKRKRKKARHSLAAAFSRMAGNGFAVLVYTVHATGEVVLIVSDAGVPQADEVKNSEDARSAAAGYAQGANGFSYAVYSNDSSLFPDAILVSDAQLWEASGRQSQIGSVPLDMVKLLGAVVVVLMIAGGAIYWNEQQKAKRLRALALAAQEADPLPRYLEARNAAMAKLGMAAPEITRLLGLIGQYPLSAGGWLLKSVECSVVAKGCISSWERSGGTTQSLLEARRLAGDLPLPEDAATDTRTVRLLRNPQIQVQGVASVQQLAEMSQAKLATANFAQKLENLGAMVKVEGNGYTRWPSVPGLVMASVPPSQMVQAMKVEISVEAALAGPLVASLPSWIWINGIKVDVEMLASGAESTSGGAAPAPKLQAVFQGMSYVR
jgi:hypothetical protein